MGLSGTVLVFHTWGPGFESSTSHPQQRKKKKAWTTGLMGIVLQLLPASDAHGRNQTTVVKLSKAPFF